MEIIETKHGFMGKCSREEFEEIKEAILKALDNDREKIEKIDTVSEREFNR